jgi:DNA-binding beta-propeller fold protein YncE
MTSVPARGPTRASSAVRVYTLDGTEQTGSTISGSTATFQRVKALAINPDNGNFYVADNTDISYYHTVAGVEQWSLDLEVFSGSQSIPMAPIDFAPDGTVYIQAKDNSEGVLIYTR